MDAVATPEVKGVPAGLTAEPLDQHSGSVRGVPEGLFAEPLTAGATKEAIAAVPKLDPFKRAQRTKADADPTKSPELKPAPQAKAAPQVKGVPAELTAHPVTETLRAAHPSPWQNLKRSFGETETGNIVESNLDQLGRMWKGATEKLNNPGAATDAEWAETQKRQTAFFERHLGQGPAKFAEGVSELGESFMSPSQLLLMAGTLGESGLVQAAQKIGVPYAVPAAKTLAKLAQLQFSTQMIEGTATAAENAARAAWNGDWWGAATGAVEGVVSGLMAKGLVSHEVASERVHRDLNATTAQIPQHAGKTFDQLNSFDQGVVIDQTVRNNPDYQALLAEADKQQEQGKDDSKKQRHARLKQYYSTAVEKAWQPDAAQRTIDGIQRAGEEDERHEGIKQVVSTIKAAAEKRAKAVQDENDARLAAAREDRPERRQAAAGARSERQKLADEVKAKREGIYAERQQAQQTPSDIAQRQVETAQAEDGTVTYPANYWGEENSFGVTGDLTGHGVYRQTARGVEWLDRSGNFVEEPADVFTHPDPATADTIARLSSLSATADTLADAEGATSEQKADAEKLASIRRDLLSGEIDAREAQKQAGIAEKVTVSDAHTAARDGQLTGPYHDSSARDYQENLLDRARELGMNEEGVQHLVDSGALLAREQTENNLHHVYRPGDHFVSKRGVKWTLDAKGMLHPDDGGPAVPLQRDGLYSNQAIQLAETGRIGYGTQTRDERRAAFAKNREVQASIRERQADVDREMRMAQQAQGLQLVDAMEPRTDAGEKAVRERRRMTRPPRPAESTESKIVRMIFQAPSDASSVIQSIARAKDVSPEEVMRQSLATDPAMSGTVEQKVAGLEPGDRVVEPIRKKPWVVEMGKDGETYLRSGNAQPVKLDRLNPSADVKGIIARGEIEKDIEPQDVQAVAFENPHYVRWQDEQAAEVEDLAKKPAPEPKTEKQAQVQVQATKRRADAVLSVATKALSEAVNDPKPVPVEQAGDQVQAAQEKVKTAEEGYAQSVEAISKLEPKDEFSQKAPVSIGLKGESGTIVQNSREVPFHYELVPIDALTTSHEWRGRDMIENPGYPSALQPRTISESEAAQNALRAERGKYDFRQYADKTINGSMGPAIVDASGQVVGGNTRLAILRKHLSILEAEPDVEMRQAVMAGMKARMRQLALESGIARYPEDGKMYVVVRMMDHPIESTREAAELGRLFNKKIGVEINKSAKGVSYSKALDAGILQEIGRLVDAHDGLAAAITAEPDFFNKIVTDRFDVGPEEEADWFRETGADGQKVKVLSEDGRNQFVKAMLGTVVKDTSILNKLQGKTPYVALERGLAYIVKMRALSHMDITAKIIEAMQAAADTDSTDAGLSRISDKWGATYRPDQQDFLGMETAIPPEPDRMTEVIWRALHAGNRTLNDRLKSFIGDESSSAISMFAAEQETPSDAFNRSFRKELNQSAEFGGGAKQITPEQFEAAVKDLPLEAGEGVEGTERAGGQEAAPPTKYKFGNTQAGIPEGSPAGKAILAARAQISDSDLAGLGKDVDEPHVTVRYGIQSDDTDRLREFIEKQQPFDARLGKTDIFPPSRASDGAAPVIAPIESPELHRIESEIDRHGDFVARTFPDYKPHATIAYVKPEVAEKYRGMAHTEGHNFRISSIDISKRDGSKETVQLKGKLGKIERPPKGRDAAQVAAANLADMKSKKGYVTPEELKTFLDTNPATKEHAPELYRTAKLMAEYVYDADPPVGVDRKEALDWVLRERLAGIESGELKSARGVYSDPSIEKGMGDGIMRLHKAADPTTFIHEFAHVIFPLLSDEDMKAIATIQGERKYAEWDGQRGTLKGDVYKGMSERLAHGMEQFLRDENPTGFTHEVKAVLAKVKDIMRKVYMAFKGDPLSDYQNTEESRGVFAKMFGITDFDVADSWRDEVKKARAEEKRLKRPSEERHPLVKMASDMGAAGIKNTIAGKVEDTIGGRVDPRKPSAVMSFSSKDAQMAAWSILPTPKIANAELVEGDGEWGIRFNTQGRIPPDILQQGIPERHPGLELEDMEKRLKETPTFKIMERKFLQVRIDNLKNRIRAERDAEPLEEKTEPGLAKAVGEEVKRGRTNGVRKAADGVPADSQPKGIGKVPERRVMGMPGHAAAGGKGRGPARESVARVPASLAEVTPVNLQPLAKERGVPRGTIEGQAFDQKAWADGLKAAGLPENTPPPTHSLDPKTAQVLKYPGQKQIVQVVMSALDQGDGAVVASATGTGKCLGRGTPVMLADGSVVKVEDVRVGDQLMGPDSRPRTVLSLASGRDQMYRIVPTKGKSYVVNEPHILSLILTQTGTRWPGGQRQVVNISVADYLKQGKTFKHRAKGYRVGVSFSRRRVTMDPYILGVWLGDGTSTLPSVTTADLEIEAFWEHHVLSRGGWIRKDTTGGRCPSYTAIFSKRGAKLRRNEVWDEIRDLGLVGNKHIPHLYKANDERTRLEVLAGLIDTDGSLSDGGYDFISKWERLSEDVAYVARSLGFAAYVKPCQKTCGNNGKSGTYYRVHISGDVARIPVRIGRKKAGRRQQKKDVLVTGIKVEPIGRGEYFGFEIDGDHLFLLGDFTVAHNTYTAMATVKEFRSMNPEAKILHITKNRGLLKDAAKVAADSFGMELDRDVPDSPGVEAGVYGTTYIGMLNNKIYSKIPWDVVIADESGEARNYFRDENKQGKALIDVINNSKKAVYFSATPFHSPMEYGYLTKLNLWPKGQFDKWIQENFAHEKIGDKIVARLDPGKQAKLRQQLIDRGQLVSQTISYEGFNAHFGVVPVTDGMKRSLDRIREGFARARDQFVKMGKKGMAEKAAAFEATYTKAFLERERIPQAIELARKARAQGWHVMLFSETSAEDLFRRERSADIEPSTYQQLDDAMGGTLSKILPPFGDVYDSLREEFGSDIVDYSGRGNTMASRDAAKSDFLTGKAPMLYTTYAAGGIGVSLHDADYPDLNVKGGDKPRVAIYLGPPYSGVLLEQAMGRPWRFGTKSDVHAVFLATDSEPDIHLMQTKVGPRMKALRAAVHGERDSLANVMGTYTDDQKVRERQDMLAYAEGDEMKVSAANFQVRSKGREVGINEWSQINFPSARDAMNKGMKYGEQVEGSDWSNLFQKGVPDRPEDARAREAVDRMANEALTGKQPLLEGLDPADRQTVTALATAGADIEIDIPAERDKDNAGRQSMEANLREGALIPYHGLMLSQEQGMLNIARLAEKPAVGYELQRMSRSFGADHDLSLAQFWNLLEDSVKTHKVETSDENMRALWEVVEGKKVSDDPAIMKLAADVSDMMAIAHDDLATAGVRVRTKTGEPIPYTDFPRDPHYMPHRIDWDYEMVDPETKEKIKVRDFLKKDEKQQQRILDSIPELKGYSRKQVSDYLRRNDPRAAKQSNIHFAREVNFPFIKKDYGTLLGYFDQASQAIAAAKNFGPDSELLNEQIDKIKDPRSNGTLKGMFHVALEPQDWSGVTGKLYNAAVAYEAASKMTFSAFKVPFHLVLGPVALKGRVMPHLRAFSRFALHPKDVMERATFAGAVVRQSSASEMLFGERMNSPVRNIMRKEGFEAAYKMVRVISSEAARVYLDQYALHDLKKGGAKAEHARRLLKNVFLIGDHGIDEAVARGRFSEESVLKGQTAFTNMAAFSGDPMQMPGAARQEMKITDSNTRVAFSRAIRLTYALQSFSVKAMSLMREHLWDEVMVHGNKKPLMYALIAFPVIGTLLNATGTGAKHVVQRGVEGAFGKKHTKDSWDNYLASLEDDVAHPEAVKALKWYIDSVTLGVGAELFKTLADPLLNIASGKPAKTDAYWLQDVLEHAAGPFFTDLYKTAEEVSNLQKIQAGATHPEKKPEKYRKSILKYASEEVPALRELPWVAEKLKKDEKKPFYRK